MSRLTINRTVLPCEDFILQLLYFVINTQQKLTDKTCNLRRQHVCEHLFIRPVCHSFCHISDGVIDPQCQFIFYTPVMQYETPTIQLV